MTVEEFKKIQDEFLQEMASKLQFKRDEYATDTDVLINFKRGAEISGEHPIDVLKMYALKHEVSLHDLFTDIANGTEVSKELFLEKATDFANYLLLAYAMFFDEEVGSNALQ